MEKIQLNERLHEIVRNSGMTQRDFATQMGVSVSVQRNYEKGLNKPNTDYLTRLYEAGFDVVYLLTGEVAARTLSPTETALLSAWRQEGDSEKGLSLRQEFAMLALNHKKD